MTGLEQAVMMIDHSHASTMPGLSCNDAMRGPRRPGDIAGVAEQGLGSGQAPNAGVKAEAKWEPCKSLGHIKI